MALSQEKSTKVNPPRQEFSSPQEAEADDPQLDSLVSLLVELLNAKSTAASSEESPPRARDFADKATVQEGAAPQDPPLFNGDHPSVMFSDAEADGDGFEGPTEGDVDLQESPVQEAQNLEASPPMGAAAAMGLEGHLEVLPTHLLPEQDLDTQLEGIDVQPLGEILTPGEEGVAIIPEILPATHPLSNPGLETVNPPLESEKISPPGEAEPEILVAAPLNPPTPPKKETLDPLAGLFTLLFQPETLEEAAEDSVASSPPPDTDPILSEVQSSTIETTGFSPEPESLPVTTHNANVPLNLDINAAAALPITPDQPLALEIAETPPNAATSPPVEATDAAGELREMTSDPLQSLQNILVGPELSKFRTLNAKLEAQLSKLENQIYDPQQLISLLKPWFTDILSMKVLESRDDVVKSLVPIIDGVIREKTLQDKPAMSEAIASLLPEAISHEISNSPKQIAKALGPEIGAAIREQIRIDRDEVAQALAPEMGRAIKEQISIERDAMVDALYPVIGSTISKYMAEAIRNINEKIKNTLSAEGLKRKVVAKMHGVSEAELIFSEVMPFTVQAAFLIHKGSGLIIAEVQPSSEGQKLESEMVGGMLTAIRSFVNDCIVQSGEIAELDEIEYGASKIMLEVAGYCYLAVVVKGEPPKPFIQKLRQTLATIIVKYGKPIEQYEGDPDSIPMAVNGLLSCLIDLESNKKLATFPMALVGMSLVVISLIALPLGWYQYRQGVNRKIVASAEKALAATPELAIYQVGIHLEEQRLTLTGKLPTQELSKKAAKVAKDATKGMAPTLLLDNQIVAVEMPPNPTVVAAEVKRVTTILNQMEGVSITTQYTQQKVTLEGTVMQMADAKKITQAMQKIPGVKSVISTLKLNPLKIKTRIYFDSSSNKLNPVYEETILQIKEFLKQYPQKGLKIIGHSDRVGNPEKNQKIAIQRAEAVQMALIKQGVDAKRLQVVGMNNPPQDVESNQPLLLSRCVTFEPLNLGANPGK